MEHTFTCRGHGLILCPFSAKDSECYRLLRNRENNRRWFFFSDPISREAQEDWYRSYLKKDDEYMFSIYTENGTFLGGAALYHIGEHAAEFGRLIVDRTAAGRGGVGTLALLLLCDLAREQLGLIRLYLEVYEDNIPAVKTYEKAGFILKGRRPAKDGMRYINDMEKRL